LKTIRRRILLIAVSSVAACALVLAAAFAVLYPFLPDYKNAIQEQRGRAGMQVLDRQGRILRVIPDHEGRFSLWRGMDQIPRSVKTAVVAAEDRRFHQHFGFDPPAMARAFVANIRRGRIVSGASTITQQVVRLIRPRPRTYSAKMMELLESVKMEFQLTKSQILELHLNLSPTGGTMKGTGLAAQVYFGKELQRVTLAEAAALAALPRSPSRFDPRRSSGRPQLIAEKDRILKRMADCGDISPEELTLNLGPVIHFKNRSLPSEAPHFVDYVLRIAPSRDKIVDTTLDLQIQRSLEQVLRSHSNRLRHMGIHQTGALIATTRGPEVLAMVGSLGYAAPDQGFNNAVLAGRGAGSTLKPFLYALALDKGYQAFSEIPDTVRSYPSRLGDYLPFNADRRAYGPVTIRSALGNSLNISAVKIINSLGVPDFYQTLQRLDVTGEGSRPPEYYGLGLAIGNIEVSLFRLVQAYTALASEGQYRPLKLFKDSAIQGVQEFSPEVAYIITRILADPSARLLTFGNPDYFDFGFPVAVKTGTSSNFRDAWALGYTSDYVVGIWGGNFDGRSTNQATGGAACGPILKDLIRLLHGSGRPADFRRPDGVREETICSVTGKLAGTNCRYTSRELVVSGNTLDQCTLPHDNDYQLVGSPYASWLHRREAEQGRGRFRLMSPELQRRSRAAGSPTHPVQARYGSPRIEIINPHDLDRFVLSPHTSNRVLLRALPQPVVEHVIWFMDGVEIARTPPPYEFFWEPTRGRHVVHAVTPSNEAAQITFHVE
jgi:penicillin-binding protein 1C